MALVKILASIMIVSIMIGAGLQVDRARLMQTLRQYGLLGRAFIANFVLVPLFAILLVRFFQVESGVAIGIVLMSIAPGVPFLPSSAGRSRGGSLSFALTIAFCFAALSVITIPLTIALIAAVIPSAPIAAVPGAKFLTTLVAFQLVPLVLGALIGPKLPAETAAKAVKILHFAFLGSALIVIVLLFPRLISSIASVFGFGRLLIIAAIGLFSLLIGWLLGGPQREYRRTLSIGTLMRNIGLCALIGTSPQFAGTLVVPTIFSYFIITLVLSLLVSVFYTRTKDVPGTAT